MKLEAVIFDMDGTLVDSEPVWWEADRRFVERFGGTYDEAFRNECVGMGAVNFTKLIRERLGLTESFEELLALKEEIYLETSKGRLEAFPEMLKLVRAFAIEKMPMAVASGSSLRVIEASLTQAGLRDYFGPHLYSSEQVARGKPFPDVFLLAADRLGVDPHDTLVFEDAAPGVEAARAAGMKVCALPEVWTDRGRSTLEGADLLFRGGARQLTAESVLEWIDTTYCQCADCTLYDMGRCTET